MTDSPASQQLIDNGLFSDEQGDLRLRGARCTSCSTTTFPAQSGCPRCGKSLSAVPLSTRGTVWTWTTQEFPLKEPYAGARSPEEFEPFTIGYVELPDGVRVESRLDIPDRHPRIGEEVELCLVPLASGGDGQTLMTFAFRPVTDG